ncbi:MAG: O-antigen ligase family protein [Clostridia bacterium]|nr:O-antigen ligase family protein [Clostridia bacterium]
MTQAVVKENELSILKRPFSLTLVIDCFMVLYITSVYTFSYNELNFISKGLAFVLMGLLAIYAMMKKSIKFDGLGVYLGLFTLVCLMSCLWAVDISAAFTGTTTMLQIFILVILLYNYIQKEEKLDFFITVMCIAATIFAVYTVLYIGVEEYFSGLEEGERLGWGINNVNSIGMTTASAFTLNLWRVFYMKRRMNIIFASICLVVSLGSGSRTAIIGIVFGIIALFTLKGKGTQRIKSVFQCIMILGILYLILQLPAFDIFMERIDKMLLSLFGEGTADNSAETRFSMTEIGLQAFAQRPLTGVGIRNSNSITKEIGLSTYLHNNYVELLATVGIFGTVFYYLMFLTPLIKLFKSAWRQNHGAIVAVILILSHLVFHFGTVSYYNKESYLYLILAWATISDVRKRIPEMPKKQS